MKNLKRKGMVKKMTGMSVAKSGNISKKKGALRKKIYKQWQLLLILVIPLLFYLLFEYVPMTKIAWAFTNFGEVPASKVELVEFIGLENFEKLLNSSSFLNAFKNTIIINVMKLIFD